MKIKLIALNLFLVGNIYGIIIDGLSIPETEDDITFQHYMVYKSNLPKELRDFVDDFATWSTSEKGSFTFEGLSFYINTESLSSNRKSTYGYNIGHWIDSRTKTQDDRIRFIVSLVYLQKKIGE